MNIVVRSPFIIATATRSSFIICHLRVESYHFKDALNPFEFLHQGFEVAGIVHVESNVSLKDTVFRINCHRAHIDVQLIANHPRHVVDQAHTVGARDAKPRQKSQFPFARSIWP